MIVTIREGDQVRASVVTMVIENFTQRFAIREDIRGGLQESEAEALLSLYEESKQGVTNAKRILTGMGLWMLG